MWLQDTHGKQTRVQREGMEEDTHTNQAGTDSTHSDMTDCKNRNIVREAAGRSVARKGSVLQKTYDSTASKYMRQQHKSVETGPRAPTVKTLPPPARGQTPRAKKLGGRGAGTRRTPPHPATEPGFLTLAECSTQWQEASSSSARPGHDSR